MAWYVGQQSQYYTCRFDGSIRRQEGQVIHSIINLWTLNLYKFFNHTISHELGLNQDSGGAAKAKRAYLQVASSSVGSRDQTILAISANR